MIKTKKSIIEAFIIATILTSLMTFLTQVFTKAEFNLFECLAVYFSFACTWLCTRQVRFNYVLGVISTILLSYTFWKADLYGSMVLNLYLIPTVIYGWFIWGKDIAPKPVQRVKARAFGLYAFFTGITWCGAYKIIEHFDGAMGRLDGWLLVGSILAQFLLDRKKIETWLVWIAVNVVSIYVYFENGLYLLAIQFAFFLANAVYAFFHWEKSMKEKQEDSRVLVR